MNYKLKIKGEIILNTQNSILTKDDTDKLLSLFESKLKETKGKLITKIQCLLVDYGTLEKHFNKSVCQVTKEIYKILEEEK